MNDYILLDQLLIKLGAILGASLLIERFLSLLNSAMNRLFMVRYSDHYSEADKLKAKLVRDLKAGAEDALIMGEDKAGIVDEEPDEIHYSPTLSEEERNSGKSDMLRIRDVRNILDDSERYRKYKESNAIVKDFWMQIMGTMIAIFACYILNFSIWEFFGYSVNNVFPVPHHTFDYLFTGIIIGSGTKPMNFLMNFVLSRKIEVDVSEIQAESATVTDSEVGQVQTGQSKKTAIMPVCLGIQPPTIEELVGFNYDGGDRPLRLENSHKYPANGKINLAVYHHTCMHSDAPFEEVVKEFDRKGWLTGYHCVVFHDGSIRVLCRWDRFGNHAKSHNTHSFGLAFQGNFETRPEVPSSNPDGSLGIQSPTLVQLQAAARVMAMYAFLHQFPPTFHEPGQILNPVAGIIPHRLLANKACPGNNFPEKEFETIIQEYHSNWHDAPDFKKALERFKNQAMVTHKL